MYKLKTATKYCAFQKRNMWEKLSEIMAERKLNMNRLAKLSGIHKSHFSDLKNGRIQYMSWPNMIKLADALDISLDVFK